MKIVGYGICGKGEADRYLQKTIDSFKRLCDETIICLNNASQAEKNLLKFNNIKYVEDNREWGFNQWKIKQDFIKNFVSTLNPDITVCLDMDEEFTDSTTRDSLEEWFEKNETAYAYIVNLWGKGYNREFSFGNVRAWSWRNKDKLGEQFFEFEQKGVHCGLAPKWAYSIRRHAPFVVLHHGLKLKKDRLKKVERYRKYDPKQEKISNPAYYEELFETNNRASNLNIELIERIAKEDSEKLTPPPHIQPLIPKQDEAVFVKRQHDGLVFTVEKERLHNQLQQTYYYEGKLYGFEQL